MIVLWLLLEPYFVVKATNREIFSGQINRTNIDNTKQEINVCISEYLDAISLSWRCPLVVDFTET